MTLQNITPVGTTPSFYPVRVCVSLFQIFRLCCLCLLLLTAWLSSHMYSTLMSRTACLCVRTWMGTNWFPDSSGKRKLTRVYRTFTGRLCNAVKMTKGVFQRCMFTTCMWERERREGKRKREKLLIVTDHGGNTHRKYYLNRCPQFKEGSVTHAHKHTRVKWVCLRVCALSLSHTHTQCSFLSPLWTCHPFSPMQCIYKYGENIPVCRSVCIPACWICGKSPENLNIDESAQHQTTFTEKLH